jgi:hypothetical protein
MLRGSNTTKKVGGWKPLGSHFKAAKNKRSLGSKSEDVKTTEIKSDDPVDETPTIQAKTKRQNSLLQARMHMLKMAYTSMLLAEVKKGQGNGIMAPTNRTAEKQCQHSHHSSICKHQNCSNLV